VVVPTSGGTEFGDELIGDLARQSIRPDMESTHGPGPVRATEARLETMYGLDVPFDVEEWGGGAVLA